MNDIRNHRLFTWLSLATAIGMLLVLLMGSLVTNTGSGLGCGHEWPLCHGKFVPSIAVDTLIEYSHRFVTGIVGLLVLAQFIFVFWRVKRGDARLYVGSTAFFTLLQAGLGAAAVVWNQSSSVLALHFGFSLLAFASTLLLYLLAKQLTTAELFEAKAGGGGTAHTAPSGVSAAAALLRFGIWASLIYCYAVVYIGAYVRHTKSAGGCKGWPTCNGELIPSDLSGATGIVFVHRLAAILLFAVIAWVAFIARKPSVRPSVRKAAAWSFYFVTIQILSGAFVTYAQGTEWHVAAALTHNLIVSCLFGTLCYAAAQLYAKGGAAR